MRTTSKNRRNGVQRYDAIIIGAGIAGLAAAECLGKAGLHVLILEARDRIGGRILSLPSLTPEHAIELGAEFVHGRPPQFDEYLRSHGLKLQETAGTSYCAGQHGLERCAEADSDVFDQLSKLDPTDFPDESFDAALRYRFPGASDEDKAWARWFVQGFHAADTSRISTHSVIADTRAEEETDADHSFHIVGGYSNVVEALRRDLTATVELRTSTAAVGVNWGAEDITVRACAATGQVLESVAPHVVITLPISLLQLKPPASGAIEFDPPLREKQLALNCLVMGPVVRMVLQFDSIFWEDSSVMANGTLNDLHFLLTRDPVFPTFWTPMPLRLPLLTAWAAGPLADGKRQLTQQQIRDEALGTLSRFLSIPREALAAKCIRSYYHDWQGDPFSRGAYSYVLAGGMLAQEDLARPLGRKLFFAGEATQSDGHHATVHGAFASGYRAAQQILSAR
jgi:monoamine oxidase